MMNFSDTMTIGDTKITPGDLHILGAFDLSASLLASGYTSAL